MSPYRRAILDSLTLWKAGEGAEAAARLEKILAAAIDAGEWEWAQHAAKQYAIMCQDFEDCAAVRARLRESADRSPVNSMLLDALSRYDAEEQGRA